MATNEYDLVVKSSEIVTPGGTIAGQVAVRNERIAAIYGPDEQVLTKKMVDAGNDPDQIDMRSANPYRIENQETP